MPDPPAPATTPAGLAEPVRQLLEGWRSMALRATDRHSAACDLYERRDNLYGIGSTVLTAIVGSTIFVTLQKTASESIRIIAGLVAAIAAVASGIQTAAKYGQLAERYRQASRHYGAVARRIDELLADPPVPNQLSATLDQLRKSLDDAGAMAPNVPPRIWNTDQPDQGPLAFEQHHDALRHAGP
jgi:hypothetical protein